MKPKRCATAVLFVLALSVPVVEAIACPFCAALSNTLSQDFDAANAVALGIFQEQVDGNPDDFAVTLNFKISQVIKGEDKIAVEKTVKLLATEPMEVGDVALLKGMADGKEWQWWAMGPLSEPAIKHVKKLPMLPTSGRDRLAYFLPLLTSNDKVLRDDAFNEFALASIADLNSLKSVLQRDKVITVLTNPATSRELMRLHWTLLSICGQPVDVSVPNDAILKHLSGSTDTIGLDAALSCSIVLGGEQSLTMIDEKILANPNALYSDVNAAVLAIRVHGTELDVIPRQRLLKSYAIVLNKADLADLVISDLARWQDWSHVDRLLKLYAEPQEKSQFLRVPVVHYLRVCPNADATIALKKCEEIDPDAVRRAALLFSLSGPPDGTDLPDAK